MRKYQQLVLLLSSIFSISLLLIYRHEYNRLHYILEVFNFFGRPCNYSELIEQDALTSYHDWGPNPLWTKDGSIFVYSSFQYSNNQVMSIIGKETTAPHSKKCYLWMYEKNISEPILGYVQQSKISFNEKMPFSSFAYHCKIVGQFEAPPFAVSFNKRNVLRHPVINMGTFEDIKTVNITVCLTDENGDLTKESLAEFLSYHKLIGINTYLVYHSNELPYRTIKLLQNLQPILQFNVTFLPYNFEYYDYKIVENDCMLRTRNKSNFTLALNVNEYISVSSSYNILNLLRRDLKDAVQINVPIVKFCRHKEKIGKPMALQSLNSIRDEESLMKSVFVNGKLSESANKSTKSGLISVNRYVNCLSAEKLYLDDLMLQYSNDFIKSTLIQMNIHGLL